MPRFICSNIRYRIKIEFKNRNIFENIRNIIKFSETPYNLFSF